MKTLVIVLCVLVAATTKSHGDDENEGVSGEKARKEHNSIS